MPHTIAECERLIVEARQRFLDADEAGDYEAATTAYDEMDELLLEFLHIPRQR